MKCKICNKTFKSWNGLGRHIIVSHNMTTKEYYDKYLKKDDEGKCVICGNDTKFISIKNGYKKLCSSKCVSRYYMKYKDRNESYFKYIDTPNKAYFLGLLSSDGTVSDKYGMVKLELQQRDEYIIEEFAKELNMNECVREYKPKGENHQVMNGITIYSKKMVDDLIKLGVVPRKTYSLKPAKINDDLLKHYWRGILDGDGYVAYQKFKNYGTFRIQLRGTEDIVKGFSEYLGYDGKYCRFHLNKSWAFEKNTRKYNEVKRIYDLLYDDECICLIRKREVFEKILNYEYKLGKVV
jgi:uncharacterized CHY-type Zn-finger protein